MVERILPALPTQGQTDSGIVAPFQFAVTGEDSIRWRVYSTEDQTVSASQAQLTLRMMRSDGTIQVTVYDAAVPNPATPFEQIIALGAGAVMNVAVRYTPLAYQVGCTYTTVQIVRGLPGGAVVNLGQILGDYISQGRSIAWPGSPIQPWWRHSGCYRQYKIAGPTLGGGGDQPFTFPFAFRPIWIKISYTASAVAGNRFVRPIFTKTAAAGDFIARCPVLTTITAGITVSMEWGRGNGVIQNATGLWFAGPMPDDILIPPSGHIQVDAQGADPNDTSQGIFIWGEELLMPGFTDN